MPRADAGRSKCRLALCRPPLARVLTSRSWAPGLGGLAVACVCADAGLSVSILERRPQLAPEGVGIVLQPNGLAVLDHLGVLEQVLEAGHRITTVRQCDPSGRVRAVASYAELRHPHAYLVCIERTSLISLLADRLPPRARLRVGCAAEALDRQDEQVCGVRYSHASGDPKTLHAACVVGADGVNSVIREAVNPNDAQSFRSVPLPPGLGVLRARR